MSDCHACESLSGIYYRGCEGCDARHLAASPAFWKAQAMGKLTQEYMAALKAIYGEAWEAGHQQVKEWDKRMRNL